MPWHRRFLIYRLTKEQLLPIIERHEKWQRMVGLHTDYDEYGVRSFFHYNATITEQTVSQYYQEAKSDISIDMTPASDAHIVGWYQY